MEIPAVFRLLALSVILGLIAEPSRAFRLQSSKKSSIKTSNKGGLESNSVSLPSSSSTSNLLKDLKENQLKEGHNLKEEADLRSELSFPRIPMWGFLPPAGFEGMEDSKKVKSHPSPLGSTKSNLEEEEYSEEFLPSSSSSHNHHAPSSHVLQNIHQNLHENLHDHQNYQQNHLPSIEEPLPGDHEEMMEGEDEEPWITNLKRSTGVSRSSGGLKRTRNYDVPQIGKLTYFHILFFSTGYFDHGNFFW